MKYVRGVPADPERFSTDRVTLIRPERWYEWIQALFIGDRWHRVLVGAWWRLKRELHS